MKRVILGAVLAFAAAWPAFADTVGFISQAGAGPTVYVSSANPLPVAASITPSGTQDVNLKQVGATTVLTGAGATGAGSQRTTVAQDITTVAGSAPGTAGTASASVLSVQGIASMTPILSTLQTQTDTVMVGGVNVKEINAVTPLMGNGVTGTGSQRVTIASDNTAFSVNPQATASTGVSTSSALVANNTTSVAVDASPGTLFSVRVFNNSATIAYEKFYDAAQGSTTCGSGTPVLRILIPANTSGAGAVFALGGGYGVKFTTAITRCVTTGIADNDTGAPAASAYIVEGDYK